METADVSRSLDFLRSGETEWAATWDYESAHGTGVPLYILFLLDSPGSMDDEIERIKETLLFISVRISGPTSRPDQRFGMVAYRDRGDEFVNTDLAASRRTVEEFSDTTRQVRAHAGTTPESLNGQPHGAVHEREWRP